MKLTNEQVRDHVTEEARYRQDLIERAVGPVADELFEIWRAPRRLPNGQFEPRVKVHVQMGDGKDKWVNEGDEIPQGATVLGKEDIANTPLRQQDPHWQRENLDAARQALEVVMINDAQFRLNDPAMRNYIGDRIHGAWLERNPWEKQGPLSGPYRLLPDEEKDKDLNHAIIAQRVIHELMESDRNDQTDSPS